VAVARLVRLRRRCARLFVPILPVNDRREALVGISLHVLPHVQHGAARGVDQCASALDERLEQFDCDSECWKDYDVVRRQRVERFTWIAEKADSLRADLIVDVRVVDDFAGQKQRAIGKALARLIGVVNGAIDAVTEAKLASEVQAQPTGLKSIVSCLDRRHEVAVITLRQHVRDFVLEVETFSKDEGTLRHRQGATRAPLRRLASVPGTRRQSVEWSQRSRADANGGDLHLAEELLIR